MDSRVMARSIQGIAEEMIRMTKTRELNWECVFTRSECDPAGESSWQTFECRRENEGDAFRFVAEREAFLPTYNFRIGNLLGSHKGDVTLEYFIQVERNGSVSVPRFRIPEETGRALFLAMNPSWKGRVVAKEV